jgi:hypothetical protein
LGAQLLRAPSSSKAAEENTQKTLGWSPFFGFGMVRSTVATYNNDGNGENNNNNNKSQVRPDNTLTLLSLKCQSIFILPVNFCK